MPSEVQDLTPLQRMWLYENQRTLSEEGSSASAPEADGDRSARGSYGVDSQQFNSMRSQKNSIFRTRTNNKKMDAPPTSSSPSWNQNNNEQEVRHGPPEGQNTAGVPITRGQYPMEEDHGQVKRRRFSYDHPRYFPGPPRHQHAHLPYDRPYYDHPGNPAYLHHMHQHHRLPPRHPSYPPYEGPVDQPEGELRSKHDSRDDTPSAASEKFPDFPFKGDKLNWKESYDNLKVYKEHYGNCNVPQKYKGNAKLGGWVNKQRKKKRNPAKYGQLKDEHVVQLEKLGFKWQ